LTRAALRPTGVVGTGRLARAMLPALAAAGYPVTAVAGRSRARARSAARLAPGALPLTSPADAASRCRLLLLAVPDRALAHVARKLADELPTGWRGRVVLHHAGSLGQTPLTPLRDLGAMVGLLHPMQCLGPGPAATEALPGSRARVEGDPAAVRTARRLARDLGLVVLRFPEPLDDEDRTTYHAAASLLSNDLLGLLALGADLLESTGLTRRAAEAALLELARGTLEQSRRGGPASALSGPVVRGDDATLRAQLECLRKRSPESARVHAALSRRLLALVRRPAGTLDEERARALERALRATAAGRRGRTKI